MKQTLNEYITKYLSIEDSFNEMKQNNLNKYSTIIDSRASYTKYADMKATFNDMTKFEDTGTIRTITPKSELDKHVKDNIRISDKINYKKLVLGGIIAAGVLSNIMDGGQQTNAQLFGQQSY